MNENQLVVIDQGDLAVAGIPSASVTQRSRGLLLRMFADPNVLEQHERRDLVSELRATVALHPDIAELRVVLGMALCVNLEVQPAIEELRTAIAMAPQSFLAQLKMGELWMRLRVADKAEEHTRQASLLAANRAQVELARTQAATIRTMRREGIERGGYRLPVLSLARLRSVGRWARQQLARYAGAKRVETPVRVTSG